MSEFAETRMKGIVYITLLMISRSSGGWSCSLGKYYCYGKFGLSSERDSLGHERKSASARPDHSTNSSKRSSESTIYNGNFIFRLKIGNFSGFDDLCQYRTCRSHRIGTIIFELRIYSPMSNHSVSIRKDSFYSVLFIESNRI